MEGRKTNLKGLAEPTGCQITPLSLSENSSFIFTFFQESTKMVQLWIQGNRRGGQFLSKNEKRGQYACGRSFPNYKFMTSRILSLREFWSNEHNIDVWSEGLRRWAGMWYVPLVCYSLRAFSAYRLVETSRSCRAFHTSNTQSSKYIHLNYLHNYNI